jgi:hypothetical protein
MRNFFDSSSTLTDCTFTNNTPSSISLDNGSSMTVVTTPCVPGDFDGDGDFDEDDYVAMGAKLGVCPGDFNGNGIVDAADLGMLLGAWGPCLP